MSQVQALRRVSQFRGFRFGQQRHDQPDTGRAHHLLVALVKRQPSRYGHDCGQPVSLSYVPLTEIFNSLAIGTLGNATTDNTAQVTLYADDLSYTTVVARPHLNISVVGGQVVLSWTASGFKLQHSSSLGADAVWADDLATVNSSDGIFSVSETPASTTGFWRLVPQ
ncbi:MAG: hypothetical protein WDM76_18250 [Limisphaerales bacterium]